MKRLIHWLRKIKYKRSLEQCYSHMESINKAAMGCCSGLCDRSKLFNWVWYPCDNCRHLVRDDISLGIAKGLSAGFKSDNLVNGLYKGSSIGIDLGSGKDMTGY